MSALVIYEEALAVTFASLLKETVQFLGATPRSLESITEHLEDVIRVYACVFVLLDPEHPRFCLTKPLEMPSFCYIVTPCHSFSPRAQASMSCFHRILVPGESLLESLRELNTVRVLMPPFTTNDKCVVSTPSIICPLSSREAVSYFSTWFHSMQKQDVHDYIIRLDTTRELFQEVMRLLNHVTHSGTQLITYAPPRSKLPINAAYLLLLDTEIHLDLLHAAGVHGIPILASGSRLSRDYIVYGKWVEPCESTFDWGRGGLRWRPAIEGLTLGSVEVSQKWITAAVSFSLSTGHAENYRMSLAVILNEVGTPCIQSSPSVLVYIETDSTHHPVMFGVEYRNGPPISEEERDALLHDFEYVMVLRDSETLLEAPHELLKAYIGPETGCSILLEGERQLAFRRIQEGEEGGREQRVRKGSIVVNWLNITPWNPGSIVFVSSQRGPDRFLQERMRVAPKTQAHQWNIDDRVFRMEGYNVGKIDGKWCQWWLDNEDLTIYVEGDETNKLEVITCERPFTTPMKKSRIYQALSPNVSSHLSSYVSLGQEVIVRWRGSLQKAWGRASRASFAKWAQHHGLGFQEEPEDKEIEKNETEPIYLDVTHLDLVVSPNWCLSPLWLRQINKRESIAALWGHLSMNDFDIPTDQPFLRLEADVWDALHEDSYLAEWVVL